MDLMKSKEAKEIDSDKFNAELLNIINEIKTQTESVLDWRGDMYRNVVSIADYLITANRIMSASATYRDKQISELNKVIIEFEECGDNLAGLNGEKKKRDLQQGLDDVEAQFKRAVKMLNNYKSGI